jgi:uncharacterized membrane protein (DUF485 family)
MAVTSTPRSGLPADEPRIDWETAERSSEFQELVTRRRRFVVPATIFFLSWYLGFVLLAGYAPDFMGESVYEGLTVGYVLALSQFVMTWGLGWMYLRKAARVFDPLAEKATARALEASRVGPEAEAEPRRFVRREVEPDGHPVGRPAAEPAEREAARPGGETR